MTWLPGYERHEILGCTGPGTYVAGHPWRWVGHTTESAPGSIDGVIAFFQGRPCSTPHFCIDPATGRKAQFIPVDWASAALKNLSGGVETNRAFAIQTEICGRAAETPGWPDEWLRFIGEHIADLVRAGIPLNLDNFPETKGPEDGMIATPSAPQRFSYGAWIGFDGIAWHQHVPENCVSVDTPILGADLVWRPAVEYLVGDELFAFEEESSDLVGRRWIRAVVERNEPFKAEGLRVITTEGEVITTKDHPWLVSLPYVTHGTRTIWVTSENLDPVKHQIYYTVKPWQVERTHTAGWLAGLLDADGHSQTSRKSGAWVGWGQVRGPMLDKFVEEMEARGFIVKQFDRSGRQNDGGSNRQPFVDCRILGGLWEQLRCLGVLQPKRLNLDAAWEGGSVGKTTRKIQILAVEPVGETWFAGLQTSSRTYIANGHLVHNSHWDAGKINVVRIIEHAKASLGGAPPAPAPVPQPRPTGPRILRIGAIGEDVHRWQSRLAGRGYWIAADGIFGSLTDGVTRWFQQHRGIGVDGVVGPQTLSAMDAAEAEDWHPTGMGGDGTPPPPPAPPWPGRYLLVQNPLISGDDVRQWQQRMAERGWRITVDGIYGEQSRSVALQFQLEKRLAADGVVGPITWTAAWTAPVT